MTHIKEYTSADRQDWDEYISSHAMSGPYLTTAWKSAIEQGYGHRTFYLAARDGGAITGVLPLALIRSPLGNANLISLPFCDYGGILSDNEETSNSLLEHAFALAREHRAGLQIRSPVESTLMKQHRELVQITNKCRMLLRLPESSGMLWSGFKSKLRSQIRKPSREGLESRLGHAEILTDFYEVFCRNMRDLGSPVHSRKWIDSVVYAFGRGCKVCVVYKEENPVGGGIILTCGETAAIPWASTLRDFNRLSPNMLLYWTFLEYATDNGFRFFDFGRSTPGEGTYSFKRQWGAEAMPLAWYKKDNNLKSTAIAARKPDTRSMAEKIWRNMPLAAANFIGPRLRKYIDR